MLRGNDVVRETSIENLLDEYDKLIDLVTKYLGFPNASKSKLQKLKSSLLRAEINLQDYLKIIANINRLKRITTLLEKNSGSLNRDSLKLMLGGSHEAPFYSDESENYFFEFDFANRLDNLSQTASIDITNNGPTATDIILNKTTAIECKKIHAIGAIGRNIRSANKQIIKRITSDPEVQNGIIALELTNNFYHDDLQEFADSLFKRFIVGYREIGHTEQEAADIICVNDRAFRELVNRYGSTLLEFYFFSEFREKRSDCKIDPRVMGIFYQYESMLSLEWQDGSTLITVRGATYLINPEYIKNHKNYNGQDIGEFFKSLAHGI